MYKALTKIDLEELKNILISLYIFLSMKDIYINIFTYLQSFGVDIISPKKYRFNCVYKK